MADQLVVTQEAKIGWSGLALPIKGRFIFRDHEGGARAAAFDAEKQRLRRRFLPFRHRAKYFRVRHFCKANAEPLAQGEFKNRRKSRSCRGNEAEEFFAPKSASYSENEIGRKDHPHPGPLPQERGKHALRPGIFTFSGV